MCVYIICLFIFVYDKLIDVEMDRCGCVLIDPHQSKNLGNWGSGDRLFLLRQQALGRHVCGDLNVALSSTLGVRWK